MRYLHLLNRWFLSACLLLAAQAAIAQQEGVIELRDTVTGNQEQPQVLYIVPWQAPSDDTILDERVRTQLSRDVFDHVERSEHVREVQYLEQLWQETLPLQEQ